MKHIDSSAFRPVWMKYFILSEHGIICATMSDVPMFFCILKKNENGFNDRVDFRPGQIKGATNGNRTGIIE
jgi:hypothetical protein